MRIILAMTRARLYLRISSDREGREIGVGRQEDACRELAKRLGAEVVEPLYSENDVSASTLSKKPRPKYRQLLEDAAADPGSYILAYSNSRLTRRPSEWDDLIKLHEKSGVTVHTVASGSVDLSRADGRGVARTIAAWDAAEAERTSERVKDDVIRRAKSGEFHGGSRSFGWTKDHKRDPVEYPILKDWAEQALAGESLSALSRQAVETGIPTARGGKWKPHIIRQMLVNPRIAGLRMFEGDLIKAPWPAVISEEKWRQLVGVLTDPSRHSGGSTRRVNLLTGLAYCGECDRPVSSRLTTSKKTGRRRVYACTHCGLYRRTDSIEAYVTSVVVRMLEEYHDDPTGADPEQMSLIHQLRDRIEAVKLEFAHDDTASPSDLRDTLRLLRGRLQAEEAKLIRANRHEVVVDITGPEAQAAWDSLSLSRKRAIIDALVEVRLLRSPVGRKPFDPATVEITAK